MVKETVQCNIQLILIHLALAYPVHHLHNIHRRSPDRMLFHQDIFGKHFCRSLLQVVFRRLSSLSLYSRGTKQVCLVDIAHRSNHHHTLCHQGTHDAQVYNLVQLKGLQVYIQLQCRSEAEKPLKMRKYIISRGLVSLVFTSCN